MKIQTCYVICAFDEVLPLLSATPAVDAVVSIEHPGADASNGLCADIKAHGHNMPHYRFTYWDNDMEGEADMPQQKHAEEALEILRRHRSGKILVHCRAGKARSAATVLLGIADEMGEGQEEASVAHLNDIRPICTPNPLLVRYADNVLQRDGRLVAAFEAHEQIQKRMPAWYEAKIMGVLKHHMNAPEKSAAFFERIPPERRRILVAQMVGQLDPVRNKGLIKKLHETLSY